ncbi:thioredoxin domain-containing protein [Marinilongibacter aquaticus]|uniref:thioredoxin domain-containing protein n=1 Tax=Marinilongibacter aquaticus TaxID=2975157 RepID=UPI0021BD3FAB|nr:thioredoxin domain-containing protein [Marinilongibacter aquaticus]UBM58480.1 thioredoxin domain-containing protein [Marinilongibacter aquaticus]
MNKLQQESSPYLKQHENNPVDWYPWGEEALQKAREESKPILVSIGYSSCHWCHVMAHESFENERLAQIMNRYFVNIKVDREERPDVDALYMDALQNMGLRGGWPLNVFLMPDAKPFYGGTYFPPKQWEQILLGIQNAFENDRQKLQQSAEAFAHSLNAKESEKIKIFELNAEEAKAWDQEELENMLLHLKNTFDFEEGGFQGAPKFPMPNIWDFLLSAVSKFQDEELEQHIRFTLDRIVLGGIFDHVGGGWTRYSTDSMWKVPHFEKMLYDNAQLLGTYAEAYRFFKQENLHPESQFLYKWAIEKTLAWLRQEMKSERGAYYAALDADSEGVEGKYYIWTADELHSLLGESFEDFADLYAISTLGNWEHGQNVLHLEVQPDTEKWAWLTTAWDSLKIARDQRPRPGLDNKLICSWNGLLLSGLVKVATVFEDGASSNMAKNLAEYCVQLFGVNDETGQLRHLSTAGVFGFLDDYAIQIQAFCDLYQLTFEAKWLTAAESMGDYVMTHFYDETEGLYFFTDDMAEELIARKKEIFDNVIPASNSMLAHAFYDLGRLLGNRKFMESAVAMFAKVRKIVQSEPRFMANWARLGNKIDSHIPEVVIAGPKYMEFKKEIGQKCGRPVYFVGSAEESELELLQGRFQNDGKTYIYVCQDFTCQLPVDSPEKALALIHDL